MPRLSGAVAVLVALGLLLGSYVLYAHDASRVAAALSRRVPLRKPLGELPPTLGDWRGEDIPLEEGMAEVAGADDYVSRLYRNATTGDVLSLYVSYYGSPRSMVGHYPDRCFPAFGWRNELRRVDEIKGSGAAHDRAWPAVVYRFRKGREQVTVVSFFNAGGEYTAERDVVRWAAHRAIGGQTRNYLAQVQISFPGAVPLERALRVTGRFLSELLPRLEDQLPSPAGRALAAAQE